MDDSPIERILLRLVIDGKITPSEAQLYLDSQAFWLANQATFQAGKWIGVGNGQTWVGDTPGEVSDMIMTAFPNAKAYIAYKPLP
jgi:hypothetical protein